MMSFDALIFGAGIAGCATAIGLARAGWHVGIVQQGEDTCGVESLAPAAVRNLEVLAISVGVSLHQVTAWWGSDHQTNAPTPGARVAERIRLAEALRGSASAAGVVIGRDGILSRIERRGNLWSIEYKRTGQWTLRTEARYLIDATGRASVIGRWLGARRVATDQLFCRSIPLSNTGIVGTWTESAQNGWWNLCCAGDAGSLSFYSNAPIIRQSKPDFASCFEETRHLRYVLKVPALASGRIRAAGSSRLVPCAGLGWAAVGDAASTVQPLASAGIAKAVRDAEVVRRALESEPSRYDRFQAREFRSYDEQLAQQYTLEDRWRQSPFWVSSSARGERRS